MMVRRRLAECRSLDAMWISRTSRLRTSASETSSVKSVAQVRLETRLSRIQRRRFKRSAPPRTRQDQATDPQVEQARLHDTAYGVAFDEHEDNVLSATGGRRDVVRDRT